MEEFSIACTECGKPVSFEIYEIPELEVHIERECSDAADNARDEASVNVYDEIAALINPRLIHDISLAIASADLTEARILFDRLCSDLGFDRLCSDLGPAFVQQNEVGRFIRRAAA